MSETRKKRRRGILTFIAKELNCSKQVAHYKLERKDEKAMQKALEFEMNYKKQRYAKNKLEKKLKRLQDDE